MVILFSSIFYILVVWFTGFQVNTTNWVSVDFEHLRYYFWSISAIVVDGFFITIIWELLARFRKIPPVIRVFLVVFSTFALDTLIFVTGVFGYSPRYYSMLSGDIFIRFVLALFVTPIIAYYLQSGNYSEDLRIKPKTFLEILNFRSDLEAKIKTMAELIEREKELQLKLRQSQETYSLALEGADAGIWDWDIQNNRTMYSARFCQLLGYHVGELGDQISSFNSLIHPHDRKLILGSPDKSVTDNRKNSIEHRLKGKDGIYRWYLCGNITKYDGAGKPIRMVGSIIDIDDKKKLSDSSEEKVLALEQLNIENKKLVKSSEEKVLELQKLIAENKQLVKSSAEKVATLEKLNQFMVDRELKMIELKKKLSKKKIS
jgi:PAS domain S-box-containing protein